MTAKNIFRPCTFVVDAVTERKCGSAVPRETWLVYVSDSDYGDLYARKEPIVRCKDHLAATVGAYAQGNHDIGFLRRVESVFKEA